MSDHNAKYGWPHRRERARWVPAIRAGGVRCARCGDLISPGDRWDLDHADGEGPSAYLGPSHRRCNRGTAGYGLANVNGGSVRQEPQPPAVRWSEHWYGLRGADCAGPCRECLNERNTA